MAKIEDIKNGILDTLDSIDRDKLSLFDLKTYAEILKIVDDTATKDYMDKLIDRFSDTSTCIGYQQKTISDMKGRVSDGM